jgi:hypothetical protein
MGSASNAWTLWLKPTSSFLTALKAPWAGAVEAASELISYVSLQDRDHLAFYPTSHAFAPMHPESAPADIDGKVP